MKPSLLRRVWVWWCTLVPGPSRLVLAAVVIVRLSGIVTLAYVLPMVWARLPRPGESLVLAVALALESAGVIAWWVKRRRLDRKSLLVDVLVSVLALVAGAALTAHSGATGWIIFAYPYVVLISFAYGLACRTLPGALAYGSILAAAGLGSLTIFDSSPRTAVLLALPSYFVNPLLAWGCARLVVRAADDLDRARTAAVRGMTDLVVEMHRTRLATALHDRVLQTLEALGRGSVITDQAMRDRVTAQAAWLRRYVETGQTDQSEDLSVGLEAAARAATRAGLTVEICDARLRTADISGLLAVEQREALIDATSHAIAAFGTNEGNVVVRAVPEDGGVLITVLSTSRMQPDPEGIDDVRSHLASAGGRVTVDSAPFAELWMPTHHVTEVATSQPQSPSTTGEAANS